MEKGEGLTLPDGPQRRNGVIPFQNASSGSFNNRKQYIDRPSRSETGPSEAVPSSLVHASCIQQLQQAQRKISALNDKLADAEDIIVRQELEKADFKQKESATKPTTYYELVIPRESARSQDKEEIAKLSAKFDVLEAHYEEAKRALEEAEGNVIALSAWQGKYGKDDGAWKALSDLIEKINEKELCVRQKDGQQDVSELLERESEMLGMEFLKCRRKQVPSAVLQQSLITPSVPQQVEENDVVSNPADNQIAELSQPQDGSQPGEYLTLPDIHMEWAESKEYEYSWSVYPQAEKRMGSMQWVELPERKKHVTRGMVVKADSVLLARIDKSQATPPTGSNGQVAKEAVCETDSLFLSQDESIRAQSIKPVHLQQVPAHPASQVHIESMQTAGTSTLTTPETSEQVSLEAAMSEPAGSQLAHVVMDGTEKDTTEAVVREPALSQQSPTAGGPSSSEDNDSARSDEELLSDLESQTPSQSGRDSPMPTMPGSWIFDMPDDVVSAPAATELDTTRSNSTSPEPTNGSLRTATRSHLDVLLAHHEERKRTESALVSSPGKLQSLQDGPEAETAHAGDLKGTERVEDTDSPAMLSDEQATGEQREPSGGKEVASGHQKPEAQPRAHPAATASKSGMQEGSALLTRLWAGARQLPLVVCVLMVLILCSFPLWAKYLGHQRFVRSMDTTFHFWGA
ncbi:hypothetical protein N7461_003693 [Penicillium sp. DV-2018c]|nr:hypothetical protein N7461_003693 [Penicillium sp. DV-2018c]